MNRRTTTLAQNNNGRHLPTNNGRQPLMPPPQRRTIFRSQIPVRIPFNPERQRAIENHMRLAFQPRNPGPYARPNTPMTARRVALSLSETQSVVKNVDTAFTVYNDRLEADFRDFRSLCGALVVQEHQEKEQWRLLCTRVIKERDDARAIINAQQSASPIDEAGSAPAPTLKRDREEVSATEECTTSPPLQTSEPQPRPMRSLPSSRSPSPPSSPQPLQPHSPSGSNSTPPPDSASSEGAPVTPARSAPPLMTVFRASSSRSPPPIIKTEDAEPEPVPKRRRSSDFSVSTESRGTQGVRMIPRRALHPSRPSILGKPTPAPPLPNEFSHVDIMYVPMNGALVCRACLLSSSKASPNHPPSEPKSFATNAPWDELREHCVRAHPDACVDVARLHPAEIFELRRRLNM